MPLIEFHFFKSRSKDYPDVIRRCNHFDDFAKAKDDKDMNRLVIYSASELLEHWSDFMVIATRIPKFAGSAAWFMGETVYPFKNEFFYKIQDSLYYCYNNGYEQTSLINHCESDWGCKQITDMTRYHSNDIWLMARHWYRYGKFEESVWKVDKGAILHALETEAKEKRLEVCPVFSLLSLKRYVDTLPNEILVDDRWNVLTRTELTRDGLKEIPFGIVPAQIEVDNNIIEPIDWSTKTEEEMNHFLDRWLKLRDL